MKAFARVETDEEGALHVRTDLRRLDACEQSAILTALALHLGFNVEALAKAMPAGPPDPRYPELTALITAARADWDRWGERLLARLSTMLEEGHLLPMRPETEGVLRELFAEHRLSVVASFAGRVDDTRLYHDMLKRGLIAEGLTSRSKVELAYRLGRGLNMLEVHRVRGDTSPKALEPMVRAAMRADLTPTDRYAMEYAKRRAGVYIRRPADQVTSEIDRVLTDAELGSIRHVFEAEAASGGTMPRQTVKNELHKALQGTTLTNEIDRIVRTELAFSHSWGAYRALKSQAAENLGQGDPYVYKFASPHACDECRRIWGEPHDPIRYRLSTIEAREAAGANFRLPRAQWGPVIGPVHPHCTEGPLQLWNEVLVSAINDAADEILKHFGH